MSRQSNRTKAQIENIVKRFSPNSPSHIFFYEVEKMKGFRIKDETIKRLALILCRHYQIDCPRAYYKDRKAACVKMDDHWDTFLPALKDFDISVEYEDLNKKRKKPKCYYCTLFGEKRTLSSTGSFGKIFEERQRKHNHDALMTQIEQENFFLDSTFCNRSDQSSPEPLDYSASTTNQDQQVMVEHQVDDLLEVDDLPSELEIDLFDF